MNINQKQNLLKTLGNAMDDIRQHLQVAKYNLRGECCGDKMEIPQKPLLVHERGIAQSERVLDECSKEWMELYVDIKKL